MPAATVPPSVTGWWQAGEQFFAAALDQLPVPDFDGPSLLPGWSRRRVVAHLARNADALANLLYWARTGVETPMYASPQARDRDISRTAARPVPEVMADCAAAAQRLAESVRTLPAARWNAQVRTAQGRTVPASEVLWMRCREVYVHAIDLDDGASFADVPAGVLVALIDDVLGAWQRRGQLPDLRFTCGDQSWGTGSVTLSADLSELAAWITGRRTPDGIAADGPVPALPPWL